MTTTASSRASKRKGTSFESEVVAFLRENGYPNAERRAKTGSKDKGDVAGVPGVCFEAKAVRSIDLAGFVDETEVERVHARAEFGVTVVKRRGRGARDAYMVMPFSRGLELLREVAELRQRVEGA